MTTCPRPRPTVSIIIPCYNAEQWIADAIVSATSQQGITMEILMIDDGSTDAGVEVAAQSISNIPNARIVRQRHSSVSHARNLGTRLTTGTYLQYLDADDVLEDGTLVARVAALERSGAAVAYCDWQFWEEVAEGCFVPGAVSSHVLSDRPEVDLLKDAWWPPGAVLYRRDLVERIGPWNENLAITQDVQFLLLAASSDARFVRVNEVGLRYRSCQGSLSKKNPDAFLTECYGNASDMQRLWTELGALDDLRRDALQGVLKYLARVFASDPVMSSDIALRLHELTRTSNSRLTEPTKSSQSDK